MRLLLIVVACFVTGGIAGHIQDVMRVTAWLAILEDILLGMIVSATIIALDEWRRARKAKKTEGVA